MKTNTFREFEQDWIYDKKYISAQNLVFKDFAKYCNIMYKDLIYLKQNYNNFPFVKNNIDKYINIFDNSYNMFIDLVVQKDKYESQLNIKSKTKKEIWTEFERFDILAQKNCLKDDVINIIDNKIAHINDKYFEKLNKIANIIFKIEESIAPEINKLWKLETINDISNYDCNKSYGLLVKVLFNWRKEIMNQQKITYCDKRIATSTSYITNEKSRFFGAFESNTQICGLVYDGNGVIAAHSEDAFLEEYIDNNCPFEYKTIYSKIMRISKCGSHDVYSMATKICAPKSSIIKYKNNFNEVIIDKRKSKPIAVFYVNKSDDFYINLQCEYAHKLAQKLSKKFNLPIISVEDKNEFIGENDINFD